MNFLKSSSPLGAHVFRSVARGKLAINTVYFSEAAHSSLRTYWQIRSHSHGDFSEPVPGGHCRPLEKNGNVYRAFSLAWWPAGRRAAIPSNAGRHQIGLAPWPSLHIQWSVIHHCYQLWKKNQYSVFHICFSAALIILVFAPGEKET